MNNPANCSTYDVSGMNWTLTGTTTDPFQFLAGVPVNPGSSYAVTIAGNKFQTRRPLGDICVTSPVINIASAGAVSITISVTRTGTGGYSSTDDDVEFKYSVNGGAVVTTGSLTGVAGSTSSKTWTGITGNTLRVWACMAANGSTEEYDLTTFTVSGGTVLPITLSGFFAKVNTNNQVVLDWQTATEKDNAYFDIERSGDGKNFKSIGTVKGKGNTSTGSNYSFMDEKPAQSTNYYRLKQTDFDGSFEYSHVLSIENSNSKGLKIYPTLVSNGILTVDTEGGQLRDYSVMNLLGQQVLSGKTPPSGAGGLDVSTLSQGTYVLKVGTEVAKFVKQ